MCVPCLDIHDLFTSRRKCSSRAKFHRCRLEYVRFASGSKKIVYSVCAGGASQYNRNLRKHMPVSFTNSRLIYDALKECDIRMLSALPETWLVHLIRLADEDPEVILVRLAKEEEGVGVSAGAHFAGV